jgi:alcohol dehydrogenase
MTHSSRAAAFRGVGLPLEIQQFPLPELAAGELLIRVEGCTLCRSDLHSYLGKRSTPLPTILGHEILGHVAHVPAGAALRDGHGQLLREGDRVTWSIVVNCGDCFNCREDLPQKCERLWKYGHEAIDERHPLAGGLADYCHLTERTIVFRVPENLPMETLAPANCATATVHAALQAAGDCCGRVVLILGAGMLGLTAVAMARGQGARRVLVGDINPRRLDRAEPFGADACGLVDADGGSLRHLTRDATQGRGADIVLEMSGSTDAVEQAVNLVRIGGRCVLVGSVFPSRAARLSAEQVVRKMITIRGIHNYGAANLAGAIEFLKESQAAFPFHELVARRFTLVEAAEAFEYAQRPDVFRVAVVPGVN